MDEYLENLSLASLGDRDALSWLIGVEWPWLRGAARSAIQKKGGAEYSEEDLAQEVVVRALSTSSNPKAASRPQFRTWLGSIAANALWGSLRRPRNSEVPCSTLDPERPRSTRTLGKDELDGVFQARAPLGFREDVALMLRSYCNCSYETIAAVLDCSSAASITNLHSRTINKLRARLTEP